MNNNGNPVAYRNYMGAFVGNFGTTTQTNTKLRMTTMWYPTTGAATMVRRDSISNASFTVADSIQDEQNVSTSVAFQLNPTSTGRYSFVYDISATAADQNASNNVDSVSLMVTDSVFSKGPWDPATGKLDPSGGRAYAGNGRPATIGPLFYVARSQYYARKAQFTVARYDPTTTGNVNLNGTNDVFVTVYRWMDGNNGAPVDSLIEGAELMPVAIGVKAFAAGDSSYETYTVDLVDYDDDQKPAILADSGWYWVAVTTDNDAHYFGVSDVNYYTRSFAASVATPAFKEFWAPMVYFTRSSVDLTSTTDTLSMFPFAYQSYRDIQQVPYTGLETTDGPITNPVSEDYCPAVTLHISNNQATTGVRETNGPSAFNTIDLFPVPASNVINVRYELAAKADRATFLIVNSMGQPVRRHVVDQTKAGIIPISTADLASGQYHLLISADGKSIGRSFTVLGK